MISFRYANIRATHISLLVLVVSLATGILGCRSPHVTFISSPNKAHDLFSSGLSQTWDEGIPLGNGLLGALIWQKGSSLRLSLDRADLWDLRPVDEFEGPTFRFSWVRDHVLNGDYEPVHRMGDVPYNRDPAPTKIPAGALEFDLEILGEVESTRLALQDALCIVQWRSGATFRSFIHATEAAGWFVFDGVPKEFAPRLVPPAYRTELRTSGHEPASSGKTLADLGYPKPRVLERESGLDYHQSGWGGMSYAISVEWERPSQERLVGVWSISSRYPQRPSSPDSASNVQKAIQRTYAGDLASHRAWWKAYWEKGKVSIPDPLLEKQWYLEHYKFGAASRRGAPPITLQAVWTADNGNLPPWKGDFHNDLNTQLSYWPCYSGNRLEEGMAFLDWLWAIKPEAERYTRRYFEVEGLNVPGVCTLDGQPMGGWIQYSLGPTVSAWLAHHFYLHWQYSRDRQFLEDRAYPFLRAVAAFLDRIAMRREDGMRTLPLSSSPEIHDNRIDAWFLETTNFDLGLIRWLYGAAAALAGELGIQKEQREWEEILEEWPELAVSEEDGRLLVAPGQALKESHRHFSHLMPIHPLGLIDWHNGERDRRTIRASIAELERLGPDGWCGYSYSWLGNLAARAGEGAKAARALRIFAECFCLPNSFHANGDQCRAGLSKFTYRPFTLEGNFAFAAGIQEMLLQSHTGTIRVFPAVPDSWRDAAFSTLRTYGAFLVTAKRADGQVKEVLIHSEKGGLMRLDNPFGDAGFRVRGMPQTRLLSESGIIEAEMLPGEKISLRRR